MRKFLQFIIFLQLVLPVFEAAAETNSQYLSSYSSDIQTQLLDFEKCVNNSNQIKDLHEVAEYLTKTNSTQIPGDWKQRFCDAQKNQQFEYFVATKSIERLPLIIKQTDSTSDGDALVPHNLVVGGHSPAIFSISSVEEYQYLKFSQWTGKCVPFLFEIESEVTYVQAAKSGKTAAGTYYIAALCRNEMFGFKYYKHENSVWSEISSREFPKTRAVENLWDWMGGGIKYTRDTPKFIQDGLKESDKPFPRSRFTIKPEVYMFYTGLTARMWAHLESGVDFWQFDEKFSDKEAKSHAIMYSEKYSIK